ncbi:MAG: hypothetical protein A3H27_08010 [Acidobacteria bacterium RIFCSPLOWO2_02_FULL_59_13]|nr:MAG: hypothetical protein A3H27_08010 [Acidobacteria bacterium RIFCSPLOWO2_02_FULL_59_13]
MTILWLLFWRRLGTIDMHIEEPESVQVIAPSESIIGGARPTGQPVSIRRLIHRVWNEMNADNVTGLAGQMS